MSSIDRLMLDTCILRDKDFIIWLVGKRCGKISISSIAYAEHIRQLLNNGKPIEQFELLLKKSKITVEPFDKNSAIVAATMMNQDPKVCETCHNFNWADTMIYANLGNPPTKLVTRNMKDFPSNDRVLSPDEVRRMLD